jgi:hypothetical protein
LERGSASGEDHELLESQGVSGVGSTIDDVHAGEGEDIWGLGTGQLSDVGV